MTIDTIKHEKFTTRRSAGLPFAFRSILSAEAVLQRPAVGNSRGLTTLALGNFGMKRNMTTTKQTTIKQTNNNNKQTKQIKQINNLF